MRVKKKRETGTKKKRDVRKVQGEVENTDKEKRGVFLPGDEH